jgi:hypothetical protein
MEACELVRLILNKITVPTEPKRAGNPTESKPPSEHSSTQDSKVGTDCKERLGCYGDFFGAYWGLPLY